jgi:hypothetical protein
MSSCRDRSILAGPGRRIPAANRPSIAMTPEHVIVTLLLLIWPVCRAVQQLALLPSRVATDIERLRAERARQRALRAEYELDAARLVLCKSEFAPPSG